MQHMVKCASAAITLHNYMCFFILHNTCCSVLLQHMVKCASHNYMCSFMLCSTWCSVHMQPLQQDKGNNMIREVPGTHPKICPRTSCFSAYDSRQYLNFCGVSSENEQKLKLFSSHPLIPQLKEKGVTGRKSTFMSNIWSLCNIDIWKVLATGIPTYMFYSS